MIRKGFSLVEVSVVVLIIGLIVAAISSGTDLIKQAELRKIVSDANSVAAAYHNFKARYDALPGDMPDASAHFSNCAVTPANCNGNGNYKIDWDVSTDDENYKAMVHLDRAGLIDGGFPAMEDMHTGSHEDIGVPGAVDDSAYIIGGQTVGSCCVAIGDGMTGPFESNIAVVMGKYDGVFLNSYSLGVLTAADSYAIDKKIDDGHTSGTSAYGGTTGNFRVYYDSSAAHVNDCIAGASPETYVMNSKLIACVIGWKLD